MKEKEKKHCLNLFQDNFYFLDLFLQIFLQVQTRWKHMRNELLQLYVLLDPFLKIMSLWRCRVSM